MTDQKGVRDGGSASYEKRNSCNRWSKGGFSFVGWSETILIGKQYRAENRTTQQTRRTKANPPRNLQPQNEPGAPREFNPRAKSRPRGSSIYCSGKNSTQMENQEACARLVLNVCSLWLYRSGIMIFKQCTDGWREIKSKIKQQDFIIKGNIKEGKEYRFVCSIRAKAQV